MNRYSGECVLIEHVPEPRFHPPQYGSGHHGIFGSDGVHTQHTHHPRHGHVGQRPLSATIAEVIPLLNVLRQSQDGEKK